MKEIKKYQELDKKRINKFKKCMLFRPPQKKATTRLMGPLGTAEAQGGAGGRSPLDFSTPRVQGEAIVD